MREMVSEINEGKGNGVNLPTDGTKMHFLISLWKARYNSVLLIFTMKISQVW